MIAAPEGAGNTHLRTLAALSRLLIDAEFIGQLMNTNTPGEVTALFDSKQEIEEAAKAEKEAAKRREAAKKESEKHQESDMTSQSDPMKGPAGTSEAFVVAVTACPTGIAHTFMAEDALKKKPRKWASKFGWRPMARKVRKTC